jgi:hypothetical protein
VQAGSAPNALVRHLDKTIGSKDALIGPTSLEGGLAIHFELKLRGKGGVVKIP